MERIKISGKLLGNSGVSFVENTYLNSSVKKRQ